MCSGVSAPTATHSRTYTLVHTISSAVMVWKDRQSWCQPGRPPRLEGRKRADQSYSAWSLDPNLLLGSGPTGKNWSPNAWEGGWQQSPGVHPASSSAHQGQLLENCGVAPQCVSIVSLRRAPYRAGMAAPWGRTNQNCL